MPVFTFECTKCHHRFDELARAGERVRCVKCGAKSERKWVGAPSVTFNGSGFYTNDYGKKK